MMKTNYLFIGMAVLMMTACNNDENETQVNDGRVAVSFAGGITLTRATTDAWEANDGIGIYMLEHGTKTVAHGAANRKYVTTAGNGEFTPAGVEQTIYFPLNADEKADFIAYYPQTDLTDDIYKVDVSDQKNPADIDLLRSDNATGKDKSTNTVDLKFFHRLSRVEVELTAGEGVSDAELAGMSITLSKQPVKADFNVLQNTLTAGQDLATLTLNTAADGKTASAIILPQEGASGRSLELTLTGGTVLTWPVEADRTFEQGKKTIFNITLKRTPVGTEVEVNATIEPWDTQGTVSGDLEI
ncbi:fimbrillin family protein [Bacteroides thetaiotaomicron]|uniref:Fimbrillin family protein n=1 Tax=Bacteroides thetaiotaomicron TaxID=818 RepID=A0AAW4Z6B6_BACT4|nr:fimbrillin family protein [Bacteroides thetaiotaomicron]MCE9236250.1 fimbrillin family protein [Bacteroides thetaiotaomicron]MCE9264938.1 fimbrillin family protein [Bacteroides thetaiotaomicron]MCE9274936.1 fimbrillin family protein [Bacteroides thetaiotaomicron]MCE9289246.1 fimbrillin family protein [Bacteroides thetaiotaomicron]